MKDFRKSSNLNYAENSKNVKVEKVDIYHFL